MKMIYVSELGHFLPKINHYDFNTSPMVVYMSASTDQPTKILFFFLSIWDNKTQSAEAFPAFMLLVIISDVAGENCSERNGIMHVN
jgi:hypothetical protein